MEKEKPHVLVVPFPGHGHMIPLLDLTTKLAELGLCLTVLTTPANQQTLQSLLETASCHSLPIQQLVIPLEKTLPGLPSPKENIGGLTPHQIVLLARALSQLSGPIQAWFRGARHRHPFGPPVCIISDFFMGWTQKTAADLGIPRVVFYPSGAFGVVEINAIWEHVPAFDLRSMDDSAVVPLADPAVPAIFRKFQVSGLAQLYVKSDLVWESEREDRMLNLKSFGAIINTFWAMERNWIDVLKKQQRGRPVWCIGPVLPASAVSERGVRPSINETELLNWLNGKQERSVIYVCFGSRGRIDTQQFRALAEAFDECGACSVWALGGDGECGTGVEEVSERRMVIRGWVPQLVILSHPSVRWFLSHCGWNSIMESIWHGVPMLTWPLAADQFYNEFLVVQELSVGVRLRCSEGSMVVPKQPVLDVLRSVTAGDAAQTEERARWLGEEARRAVAEGGSSHRHLLEFVEELRRLQRHASQSVNSDTGC